MPNIKMHTIASYNSKETRGKHYIFHTEENWFLQKKRVMDGEGGKTYFLILKDKTSPHLLFHKKQKQPVI